MDMIRSLLFGVDVSIVCDNPAMELDPATVSVCAHISVSPCRVRMGSGRLEGDQTQTSWHSRYVQYVVAQCVTCMCAFIHLLVCMGNMYPHNIT